MMDIDLWFMPTLDNTNLNRIAQWVELCASTTAFYPSVFDDPRTGLRAKLFAHMKSADVVHFSRLQQLVSNIDHPCMVWDVDELPWSVSASGPGENPKATRSGLPKDIEAAYGHSAAKCRLVMASSPLERPAGCVKFVVVPNVVSFESSETRTSVEPSTLIFVGNLNFVPNIDALTFFTHEVLPILSSAVPDIRVRVVGRAPVSDEARRAIASSEADERIHFDFDVPDCAPFYERTAVAISPVRLGGGTRIKILEAFAHRCPVVSTAKGCEGLDVQHGKQLMIANSANDFARACVELLRNPPLRHELAKNAFRQFASTNSQSAVDRLLESAITELF